MIPGTLVILVKISDLLENNGQHLMQEHIH